VANVKLDESLLNLVILASPSFDALRFRHQRVIEEEEEEEKQPLKVLALKQPRVWSVSNFIFLALAYEGRWPVLSLAVSP